MILILVSFVTFFIGYFLGHNIRDIKEKIKDTKFPFPKEERKSTIIEAETPEQQAMREHKERMERLNPGIKV